MSTKPLGLINYTGSSTSMVKNKIVDRVQTSTFGESLLGMTES